MKNEEKFKKIPKLDKWTFENRQLDNWTIENRQLDKWTFEMDNWTIEVGQLDNWTIRDSGPPTYHWVFGTSRSYRRSLK